MSSTLLQEEYPLSVDFVGLPEICTSYISNQAAKGSFLKTCEMCSLREQGKCSLLTLTLVVVVVLVAGTPLNHFVFMVIIDLHVSLSTCSVCVFDTLLYLH